MEELTVSVTDGKIKYNKEKGPVLKNAKVQLIFWGNWDNPSVEPSKEKIEIAVQNMINSDYYSKLSQYGGIQKPTYLGTVMYNKSNPKQEFVDNDIKDTIRHSIRDGLVPDFRSFSNGEIIYIVIIPPGHKDLDDDEENPFDAFHNNFEYNEIKGVYAAYYGFMDETRTLEDVTMAIAHEIAEACTNPGPKKAFTGPDEDKDKGGYEIADYCEEITGIVNGEKVEGYWSNVDGRCVIAGGSNITQDKK